MRRRSWLLALALVALTLGACGVPVDPEARSLAPLPNLSPPSPASNVGACCAEIYYLQGSRLVGVERHAASLSPTTALTLLIQEPSANEAREGIASALAPNEALYVLSVNGGVITVALPSEFLSLSGSLLYEAFGQIVFTLTDPANDPGGTPIAGIDFKLRGAPWNAYLPDFRIAPNLVVTRKDYATLTSG